MPLVTTLNPPPQAIASPTGATIFLAVADLFVGECLRRLEHHADIHLIHRIKLRWREEEIFVLRGLDFPVHWEGKRMQAYIPIEFPGISEFRPLE